MVTDVLPIPATSFFESLIMISRARSILGLLGLLLVVALTGCGKSPEEHFQAGQALLEKNDYKAAILELKSTLQEQPGNREARLMLGKAYLAREAYADAEKELNKAKEQGASYDEVSPALSKALLKQNKPQKVLDLLLPSTLMSKASLAVVQLHRAEAFLQLNKPDEANQAIALAEQADAKLPELLLLKARMAVDQQNLAEAYQLANTAISANPKMVEGHFFKATLYESEQKFDQAVQEYEKALLIDPKNYRAFLEISDIQSNQGKKEAAEKALKAAEAIAPEIPLVKYSRGILELRNSNFKAANEALLQFLRVAPDYPPAQLASALANLGLGNIEQSMKMAQLVLSTQPDNLIAARVVASSQLKTGEAKNALATLEPLLKSRPDDPQLLSLMGEAYFQVKDYKRSLDVLNQAAQRSPSDEVLINRQAATLLALGQTDQALAELQRATVMTGQATQSDLALITLSLQQKQFDKALRAVDALEKKLPNSPIAHHLRAVALIGQNDLAAARKSLDKAVSIEPRFYPAVVNLARLDLAENKPDSAIKRLDDFLAKEPDNLQAMLARAELALINHQEKEYVVLLEKASKAHPKALQPNVLLSRYYLLKKDNTLALVAAKEAVRNNPDDYQALNLLAVTQMATRDARSGVETYKKLVQKAANSAEAHLGLGVALSAAGRFSESRDSLNRAIAINPNLVDALDAFTRLEIRAKNYGTAMQWAKKIQTSQAGSPLGYDREGDILMIQKKYDLASKAYQLAQTRTPSTQGVIKLHAAMVGMGNLKAAQGILESWVKSHPDDITARHYVASKAVQSGDKDVAVAQYEEILRRKPNDVMALNNLASLYQKRKNPRALVLAETANQQHPDNYIIQDTMGWILVEQGQLKKGLELLAKAAGTASNNPTIQFHYASALIRDGNKALAREVLRKAIASQTKFPEAAEAKILVESLE